MTDINKELNTGAITDTNKEFQSDEKASLRSAISYTTCVLKGHNVSKKTHYCYTCKKQH